MDPYQVLGVDRAAADDDIRRAFRKLAKAYHPDLNPSDEAAAEQFRRLSAAYDIIGDPPRRRQFDCGEIDESGQPRAPFGGYGGRSWADAARGPGTGHGSFNGDPFSGGSFTGFSEIFEDVFGQRTAAGARARAGFPGGGAGAGGPNAGGAYARSEAARRGADVRYGLEVDLLEALEGTKKRVTMPGGGVLDLTVPAGIEHGQVLRLRGKGHPGLGSAPAGDALVEIKVRPHKLFSRVGRDIHAEAPVSIDEAVLGGRIEVSTVSGRVQLSLPPGTANGRVFRLKGKGVPEGTGQTAGDHFVTIRVVMPEAVDEDLRDFFQTWRKDHSYEPGER
ncbi:MAG: J domain-containing protein [Pseudomonadota bacterium]